MRNAKEAIHWMSNHHETTTGMCLWTVQEAFAAQHLYPNAAAAWHSQTGKHHGDRIPRGGVAYWLGGSHGYGHIAISLGDDMILSTDLPRWGSIGRTHLHTPRTSWGLRYAGWTDHINGVPIEGIGGQHMDVYLRKLRYGQVHSASVKHLQVRLNKALKLNQSHHHIHLDGNYSAHTDHAVRRHQAKIGVKVDPEHRSFVGPKQAKALFGKHYLIHA